MKKNCFKNGKYQLFPLILCEIIYPYDGENFSNNIRKVLLFLNDQDYSEIMDNKKNLRNIVDYELEIRYGDIGYYLENYTIVKHDNLISSDGTF